MATIEVVSSHFGQEHTGQTPLVAVQVFPLQLNTLPLTLNFLFQQSILNLCSLFHLLNVGC